MSGGKKKNNNNNQPSDSYNDGYESGNEYVAELKNQPSNNQVFVKKNKYSDLLKSTGVNKTDFVNNRKYPLKAIKTIKLEKYPKEQYPQMYPAGNTDTALPPAEPKTESSRKLKLAKEQFAIDMIPASNGSPRTVTRRMRPNDQYRWDTKFEKRLRPKTRSKKHDNQNTQYRSELESDLNSDNLDPNIAYRGIYPDELISILDGNGIQSKYQLRKKENPNTKDSVSILGHLKGTQKNTNFLSGSRSAKLAAHFAARDYGFSPEDDENEVDKKQILLDHGAVVKVNLDDFHNLGKEYIDLTNPNTLESIPGIFNRQFMGNGDSKNKSVYQNPRRNQEVLFQEGVPQDAILGVEHVRRINHDQYKKYKALLEQNPDSPFKIRKGYLYPSQDNSPNIYLTRFYDKNDEEFNNNIQHVLNRIHSTRKRKVKDYQAPEGVLDYDTDPNNGEHVGENTLPNGYLGIEKYFREKAQQQALEQQRAFEAQQSGQQPQQPFKKGGLVRSTRSPVKKKEIKRSIERRVPPKKASIRQSLTQREQRERNII